MQRFYREAQEALSSRRRVLLERERSAGEAIELHEIDAALTRISRGSWGHCEMCTGPIGRGRLRGMPEVRHCLSCSEKAAG